MGAVQFWSIATLMVIATTAVVVVPMFWTRGGADAAQSPPVMHAHRRWYALGIAIVVPVVALAIYTFLGNPEVAVNPAALPEDNVATMHARAALRGGDKDGGDLDAVTSRLRARLAANPDDADGWRLLAQSYEFQGRTSEAADARKHIDAAAPSTTADEHRRKREFPQAIAAYAELARRGGMSADQWADYADALGGARGKLDDEAAGFIDAALRIDPDHPKALWLRASWQTQRRDHPGALTTWERLAAILPADSPDARIIAANIAEARGKTSAAPGPRPSASTTTSATPPAALRGIVQLDPRMKGRVAAGDVLFVFARAADERGPPLAVMRTAAGSWPQKFSLDDSHAMMPGRKLSDFTRVILEARISRTGNALAQPGDLRGVSPVLDPRAASLQRLTIADEVPGAPAEGG